MMRSMFYVEDANKQAVPVETVEEWARYFQDANRTVAMDRIEPRPRTGMDYVRRANHWPRQPRAYVVSTVFLGLDHAFTGGPPLLYETMVFAKNEWDGHSGLDDLDCDRCTTRSEAVMMHAFMVEKWQKEVER